jgi:hypothetical protein
MSYRNAASFHPTSPHHLHVDVAAGRLEWKESFNAYPPQLVLNWWASITRGLQSGIVWFGVMSIYVLADGREMSCVMKASPFVRLPGSGWSYSWLTREFSQPPGWKSQHLNNQRPSSCVVAHKSHITTFRAITLPTVWVLSLTEATCLYVKLVKTAPPTTFVFHPMIFCWTRHTNQLYKKRPSLHHVLFMISTAGRTFVASIAPH